MSESIHLTPLMKQYFEIKNQFQDALVLFQVGDFYEIFLNDAKKAASFLGIALTKRGNVNGEPIALCGVPVHAIEHYLSKLVRGGFKVVLCNQLEQATPGKVVRRGVSQVFTPGTLTDSKLLNEKSASYLFSFFPTQNSWGMLFGELLTAQLYATSIQADEFKLLESELARFFPDEILIPNNLFGKQLSNYFKHLGYYTTIQDFEENNFAQIQESLNNQFYDESFKSLCGANKCLMFATYNFYNYLKKNQENSLEQFKKINFYKTDDFLILDSSTQKNLELIKNNLDGTAKNSLFELVDKATTSMGSRLIKKWIVRPLVKKDAIIARQNSIEIFVKNVVLKDKLISCLREISDLERIVGRIAIKKAQLNDYLMLCNALTVLPEIKKILKEINNIELISIIESKLQDFSILKNLLSASLNADFSKNWTIKPNFNLELDNLRELVDNANNKIIEFEQNEQKNTGINSLKVRFNAIHGYYIEITKTNLNNIPSHYIRNQTLAGKERFITKELQQLEFEIENARKQITSFEQQIFENIKFEVGKYTSVLRHVANALANLDSLIGFANVAYENGYIKPLFNDNRDILIQYGRHPIVEKNIKGFIANSTNLTNEESLLIITGPNMGGKSTYLRQTALICILAQCGSFVPAESATLPILDKIFTRIGSGDNLAEGKSTFLVEMEETANICNQATNKSLVILDEVGRGTSTFDGLAIAQSVVEYIYTKIQARCLFATHYHELTELQNRFPGIVAYHAASKKTDDGILFLHKIIRGTADSSFGVEVAGLAKLPPDLILRAKELLENFENNKHKIDSINIIPSKKLNDRVNELERKLNQNEQIFSDLKKINFDELSPKMAFDILWKIKEFI